MSTRITVDTLVVRGLAESDVPAVVTALRAALAAGPPRGTVSGDRSTGPRTETGRDPASLGAAAARRVWQYAADLGVTG